MNKSLWISTSDGIRYEKLKGDKKTECLIVGGGIAGLTTAYLLCKKGVEVTLVDANFIGHGATGRNTGKVTAQHSIIYSKIYKKYGPDKAKQYYDSNEDAIKLIEDIINENYIKCDYENVPSYLFTQDEKIGDMLVEEFDICKEIGVDCEFLMDIPIPLDIKGAIKFNTGAQFNPKKYIDALSEAVNKLGGEIYENTPMKQVELEEDGYSVISRDGQKIHTKKLIICSHVPFYDGMSFYFTRLKPERSYIVAGKYDNPFPKATFINADNPKRSIRAYDDGEKQLLLIGGESHKVGHDNDEDYYTILKEYGNRVFGVKDYSYQWSAQDYISPDYIPYIGYINSVKDNIFVATGFAKWGMTNGTVASMIISEMYLNGTSEYQETFSPSRTEGYYSKDFFKENADVGIQYAIGKLKIASKDMPEKGEGKVVNLERSKYGAYRDEKDELHIVDITCTHLGCELKWNPLEKSWDCPCHGSRFDIDGNILEGPATVPLNQFGAEQHNTINPNLL